MVVSFPDETLPETADRMATTGLGVLPVVERGSERRLRGILTSFDLLAARERNLQEERQRERVLRLRGVPRLRPRAKAPALGHALEVRLAPDADPPACLALPFLRR